MNYFDYAACCKPFQEALDEYTRVAMELYANPSSSHEMGAAGGRELRSLRKKFYDLVNFDDGRLILTSGGTESNNLAITSHMSAYPRKKIAVSEDAHASIIIQAEIDPERVQIIGLLADGKIDQKQVLELDAEEISLLCIPHASNETGVIQEVGKIAETCVRKGIPVLCDGTQALGKIPVDLAQIPVDYYAFSAHKFGGPHGFGGLFFRGENLIPQIRGGSHEWGIRAGTENLPGLAAATKALELSLAVIEKTQEKLRRFSNIVIDALDSSGLAYIRNGDVENALPGFLSISFPNCDGRELATALNVEGFAVSTGSACHANTVKPSRAILALGRAPHEAIGTVRITAGRLTTEEEVGALTTALIDCATRLSR